MDFGSPPTGESAFIYNRNGRKRGPDLFLVTEKSFLQRLMRDLDNMAKQPNIEAGLSEVLDTFLKQLDENEKYLLNGIFTTNFGEAALLLQSSVDVYGKKVDLLWKKITEYQSNLIVNQNDVDEEEAKRIEERITKHKRKRKRDEDQSKQTKKTHQSSKFSPSDLKIASNAFELDGDVLLTWDDLSRSDTALNMQLDNKSRNGDAYLFLPDATVATQDEEITGKYDSLRFTNIVREIFDLEDNDLLRDCCHSISRMRIASYLVSLFRADNPTFVFKPREFASSPLYLDYVRNFIELRNKRTCVSPSPFRMGCSVNVEKLSPVVVGKKLGRTSVTDHLDCERPLDGETLPDSFFPTLVQLAARVYQNFVKDPRVCDKMRRLSCGEKMNGFDLKCYFEKMRKASVSEGDVGLKEDGVGVGAGVEAASEEDDGFAGDDGGEESQDEMENEAEIAPNVINGNIEIIEEVPCEPAKKTPSVECRKSERVKTVTLVVRKLTRFLEIIGESPKKRPLNVRNDADEEGPLGKRRRLSKKALLKLSTGVSVEHRNFERFYAQNYEISEGEGERCAEDLNESEEILNESDNDMDDNGCDCDSPLVSQDSGIFESSSIQSQEEPSTSQSDPSSLPPGDSPPPSQDSGISLSDHDSEPPAVRTTMPDDDFEWSHDDPDCPEDSPSARDDSELEANVSKWKSFITPRLKSLEQRKADFDIHEYGKALIADVPLGGSRKFGELVRGKSSAEVTRCFISALQLANTYNVELTGCRPGRLSNETLELTVLSEERHHEKLPSYQAPSEETFGERLARVQALNPRAMMQSTPVNRNPVKPSRGSCSSSGKGRKRIFFD